MGKHDHILKLLGLEIMFVGQWRCHAHSHTRTIGAKHDSVKAVSLFWTTCIVTISMLPCSSLNSTPLSPYLVVSRSLFSNGNYGAVVISGKLRICLCFTICLKVGIEDREKRYLSISYSQFPNTTSLGTTRSISGFLIGFVWFIQFSTPTIC
jgi:hypothetical protein